MGDDEPPRRERERSRSPRRAPKSNRGFRWKDHGRSNGSGSERRDSDRRRDGRDRSRSPSGRGNSDRTRGRDRERRQDEDRERPRSPRRTEPRRSENSGPDKDKKEKKKAPKPAPGPQQEMIIVHINDRLGTKTAVPCLPSDTVGQLKLMIAARIGREAGQIMLRRQGERPFKDVLSLEDYGISNGVQLDLEIDTGD